MFDFFVNYDATGIFFIPFFYTLNFICIQKIKIQIIEQKYNKIYPIFVEKIFNRFIVPLLNLKDNEFSLFLFIQKN